MSVGRAQREISSKEFGEWMAYEDLDPGEPERSDLRAALIACTVANSFRDKRQRAYELKDFLLKFDEAARPRPSTQKEAAQELKVKLLTWKRSIEERRRRRAARAQGKR